MSTIEKPKSTFIDRRSNSGMQGAVRERRQFSGSYDDLSPAGQALGQAIDEYKARHRRRFITYDEMVSVIESLGYQQAPSGG